MKICVEYEMPEIASVAVPRIGDRLEMMEPLAGPLGSYFYFYGVKGSLLLQLGRNEEARAAFDRAIALANTAAEAAHIRMHLDRLKRDSAASDPAQAGS